MGNCCKNGVSLIKPDIFTADISKVARHSYAGQYKYCRLDNIYDGDTADIYFFDESRIVRRPFRFYGYDSAEMKPLKKLVNREEIKAQAVSDKQFLSSLITNQKLVVKFMENEKYGRMMGEIWRVANNNVPEENLSMHPDLIEMNNITNIMINSGHGKPYYGGSKEDL